MTRKGHVVLDWPSCASCLKVNLDLRREAAERGEDVMNGWEDDMMLGDGRD
jgi:hypothetical protein